MFAKNGTKLAKSTLMVSNYITCIGTHAFYSCLFFSAGKFDFEDVCKYAAILKSAEGLQYVYMHSSALSLDATKLIESASYLQLINPKGSTFLITSLFQNSIQ